MQHAVLPTASLPTFTGLSVLTTSNAQIKYDLSVRQLRPRGKLFAYTHIYTRITIPDTYGVKKAAVVFRSKDFFFNKSKQYLFDLSMLE